MDKETLWRAVLAELEIDSSPVNFKTFLLPTRLVKKEGDILEIACPTSFGKKRLEERYYGQIKRIVDKITKNKNELVFIVGSSEAERKTKTEAVLGPLFAKKPVEATKIAGLSPYYTFANFIVGSSNNLAQAVAQGVVAKPGKLHNPYFLYSDVGLGKTHLIQAIGNALLARTPNLKILYCTSEDFTNELVQALRSKKTASFRNKFRRVDVLLIDDIQFIAGKDTIQEEIFHTFNTLYHTQKQIVLTSDRPPKEITKLEKRLSSRFGCGMVADIQPPDYATRVAILRNKREQFDYEIEDSFLDQIAQMVETNIRDLEGAFNQIITKVKTEGMKITPELITEVVGKDNPKAQKRISPKKILETVCTYYSVKRRDLIGKSRPKEIVFPRQVTMYLLRTLTELPLMSVGELLGGRDHTTIIHGERKIAKKIKEDSKLRQDILNIKQTLS